ncbi:hypothetical protein ASE12_11895 [Aeromicrobium sp. Root236]|uniref:deoxyguanosinetriphosphate triphosphohydrolase family protein n=1 Tax=Aeromicrobium sp. Root236 TaxID=1736498 RepID=UPI0006F7E8CE|nr:dNTP triphosphohydrolase [Aeromicrobium sp. Root236]KRC65393.1 hypothetical protein ASE12_11895 [Aeromicrobium sp. Root236]
MTDQAPPGYTDEDVEQDRHTSSDDASGNDPRNQFKHDHDRVLYSSAFAALAGKSQVVSAGEAGQFHTRLTHSLKVTQVGRRLAERFACEQGGPDPDLVATACLAHDLGHPPFGHAGEVALDAAMKRLCGNENDPASDGFEGNAQNLRILTHLEAHKRTSPGLHLSRAALDATTKYPWLRDDGSLKFSHRQPHGKQIDRGKKFGFYKTEADIGDWILNGRKYADRPIEEQIMDWADDVTYACHDLLDFFRSGAIPLDRLLEFDEEATADSITIDSVSDDLSAFLAGVKKKWVKAGRAYDESAALAAFVQLQELLRIRTRHSDSFDGRVNLASANSRLITSLLGDVSLTVIDEALPHTRYNAILEVPDDLRLLCNLLKELIWTYVINNPRLATQQHGQETIVTSLLDWYYAEPKRLLPISYREDLDTEPVLRVCVDHVSSLTEVQASNLYRRMSGVDLGAFTDNL